MPAQTDPALLGNYGFQDSRHAARKTFVYFAHRESDGALKIGISQNPKKRQSELRTALKTRVNMLAWKPGDEIMERSLHERFKHLRLDGEWFQPTRALLDVVEDVRREMEADRAG